LNKNTAYIISLISLLLIAFSLGNCSREVKEEGIYLNLADSVAYVGVETCRNCHYDKHQTFMHTGMGQSFDLAHQAKSKAEIHPDSVLYDAHKDLYYHPYWEGDSLMLSEYRLKDGDTVHSRQEQIDYIIGSGQHTNSHIYDVNGYLHQVPFTYYTQEGRFDLPPGYEEGNNTRFDRKIGLECMSCHNSLPEFVMGSENKFEKVHLGISCERCHGPGEIHVQQKMQGIFVDTANHIDYSIVNPAKISAELQFEICSRCHLQGNAVLQDGQSFFDFKPGMKLEQVMDVYLPKYKDDNSFIMASHVDRLKMSECFISSRGELTCVTCHNPHVSVKVTASEVFNSKCQSCHQTEVKHEVLNDGNCVECHMPRSGSIDIPHVTVTDHKIGIHSSVISENNELKEFIGLYCVNNSEPSEKSLLKAYLQQYEKFGQESYYLDSAYQYLLKLDEASILKEWVQYYFFRSDFQRLTQWVEQRGFDEIIGQFDQASYTNDDAWALYRVGESYYKIQNWKRANACFEKATTLAPFHLEIQNKYAMSLMRVNRTYEARKVFEFIIAENPNFEKVYANYGYLLSLLEDWDLAKVQYDKALSLNPDLLFAWLNSAAYYLQMGKLGEARYCLEEVIRIEPNHAQAQQLLKEI